MRKINLLKVLFFVLFANIVLPSFSYGQLSPEKEKALREELQSIEDEIKQQQQILSKKQLEGSSIERDVAILNAQIKEAQLKIKKHTIAIENLGKDISFKVNTITKLGSEISKGQQSLAQIVRKTNELDNRSLTEVLLSSESLSDSFEDLDEFLSLENALKSTFGELREAVKSNEEAKQTLSQKRNHEIDTKVNVEAEKKKIEVAEAEKKRLLALNKVEQASYQQKINDKAKRASEIRAALFSLRDSAAIPFGTALEYAKKASKATGVRPAFVLAILTQESNLGANVGSCYLTNTETGAGIRISTGLAVNSVMKPTRDVVPFLSITKSLGRDYTSTRVSCPFSVGYGGAMGPAQFIPSTWMLFKDRIAEALGVSVADPWNPEHAFTASAMYLSDLGASAGTYTAEKNAACRYYSGRPCGGTGNSFYGDQVMSKATTIQSNIDFLNSQ